MEGYGHHGPRLTAFVKIESRQMFMSLWIHYWLLREVLQNITIFPFS